ncbi:hypothetical protein ColKHC_14008 [Colletotrichum higginsianum]|nr:hypothetical protein ColKHC_14008 [Colletotrichum higginsianum]
MTGNWKGRCIGYTFTVTENDVSSMVETWSRYCEPNMPTIHIFENKKVIVISLSSSVLIRPIRLNSSGKSFSMESPFIDMMCVYHCDTMKFLAKSFPKHNDKLGQMTFPITLMIPFYRFAIKIRTSLGIGIMKQALCMLPTKGDATIVINSYREPSQ